MLGEFFGLTGVSAAMLDLSTPHFSKLCGLLNNRLDVFRLTKFKDELEYLKYFLQEKVQVEYNSPEVKKLLRQASLIRSKSEPQLKRSFNLDIAGMSDDELEKLARQKEQEAEDLARSMNISQTVVNSFKLHNKDERVKVGEYELAVLLNFKRNYLSVINNYHKNAVTENFQETMVFGRKLHDIATRSPRFLVSIVETMFSQPGVDVRALVQQCLEWVKIFRSYFVEEEEIKSRRDVDALLEHFNKAFDFRGRVLSLEGLDPVLSDTNLLTHERQELLARFDEESVEFATVMRNLITGGLVDKFTITVLVDLYFNAFRMDHDVAYACELLFPESSGILVSKEELKGIYNNLNNIEFFCFNTVNSKLMVESLKKISFSFETKTVIDPEKSHNGYTFALALEDIEYLCYSLRPMGSKLEEVVS